MKHLMRELFLKITKGEAGAILVYMCIAIVPFLAMMGLVIDYGHAAVERNKMQKAVDAAALGGAAALPGTGYYATPYSGTSEGKATQLCEANYPDADGFDIVVANPTVKVDMKRGVSTFFMRLFGKHELDVTVTATALRGSPMGANTGHMMPFSIINPNTNDDPLDDLVPSNWGKEYILAYGSPNIAPQDWENGDLPAPPSPKGVGSGQGWRGALRLNSDGTTGGSGASDFRDVLINGWDGTAETDDIIPVLTGNIDGPIRQGRESRLDGEEGLQFGDFDLDKGFIHNRIILVPIVSLIVDGTVNDRLSVEDFRNGIDWDHSNVILDGFATFWLQTASEQGDVNGDGNFGDEDYITGIFIPGTRVPTGSEGGGDYYGSVTPPRLIE